LPHFTKIKNKGSQVMPKTPVKVSLEEINKNNHEMLMVENGRVIFIA
jgi:hypothetical protein